MMRDVRIKLVEERAWDQDHESTTRMSLSVGGMGEVYFPTTSH